MSNLSVYLTQIRLAKNLPISDLARQLGYQNIATGVRQIEIFERNGKISNELLEKLVVFLKADRAKIRQLLLLDMREWLQAPTGLPYPFYGVGKRGPVFPLPHHSPEAALELASYEAQNSAEKVRLVLSRRIEVVIDQDGKIKEIIEAGIPLPSLP